MRREDAKRFYEEKKIPRYGFLQTSKGHLFTEFAKRAKTDSKFASRLMELGSHMARLHKEATTAKKTEAFLSRTGELIRHHERKITSGTDAKEALRSLKTHFEAPTLSHFLKQAAVVAVKEKTKPTPSVPTAPKPTRKESKPAPDTTKISKPKQRPRTQKEEAVALRAASALLPKKRGKPGLVRHALGALTLGGLLAFGVPFAMNQLPKPTKVELRNFGKREVVPIHPFVEPKPPKDEYEVSDTPETTGEAKLDTTSNRPVHVPLFELVKMPGKNWEEKLGAYVKKNKIAAIMTNYTIEPNSTSGAAAGITPASPIGTANVETEHEKKGSKPIEIEATEEGLAREAKNAIVDARTQLKSGNPEIAARHYAKAISMGRRLEGADLAAARKLILLAGKAYNADLKRALEEWHPKLESPSPTPQ